MAELTFYDLGRSGDQIKAFLDKELPRSGMTAKYIGAVATKTSLPASGNSTGDLRYVQDENTIYLWNGAKWIPMGLGDINLADFVTQEDLIEDLASQSAISDVIIDGGDSTNT